MKKITLMQCDLPRYLLSTVSCLKVGRRMFERVLRTSGEGALGLDSQLLVLQPLVFREASRLEGRSDSIAWEVNRQSCSLEEGGGCVGSSVPCGPGTSGQFGELGPEGRHVLVWSLPFLRVGDSGDSSGPA